MFKFRNIFFWWQYFAQMFHRSRKANRLFDDKQAIRFQNATHLVVHAIHLQVVKDGHAKDDID